ncbi:ABC transporter permease [Bacillus alkalicellulosilyticus]|uniref:ABC transporter permease n=1 Tax=Alkalihalobacterium alkalicellulosilyticum TaxID=1912214 RepID=UPI000998051B|nr:ABC transporter permease [Bacillus alkalicellulosilyticus]
MANMFWSCVWLRCKWWIKRPFEVLFLVLLLPLLMLLLISLTQSVTQNDGIPLAIVDEDDSDYSRLIVKRVHEHPITSVEVISHEQAERFIQTNRVEAVIIFRQGFMSSLLEEQRKETVEMLYSPSSITQGLISEVISSEILRLSSNVKAAHYVSEKYYELDLLSFDDQQRFHEDIFMTRIWEEAWSHSDSYWEPEPLMSIDYQEPNRLVHMRENRSQQEEMTFSLVEYDLQILFGYLSTLIFFMFVFVQQWLVEEKLNGVQKRLGSMSVPPLAYVIGHSVPSFVFVTSQGILSLLIIFWSYDFVVPLSWQLVCLFIFYMLATFTLSLYIAVTVKNASQLHIIGTSIVLFTSLVGGSLIHITEWMPWVKWLSMLTPQGWLLYGWDVGHLYEKSIALPSVIFIGCILLFACLSLGRWRKQLC